MKAADRSLAEKLLHDLSQAATALECGLEIGLRQDGSFTECQARFGALLEIAKTLHQQIRDLQTVQSREKPSRRARPSPITRSVVDDTFNPLP